MFKNHLLYRLTIFDALACSAVAWGWQMGFVGPMFAEDTSRISFLIVAVFLVGKTSLFIRARKVSRLKNILKGSGELAQKHFAAKMKPASFVAKHEHLSDMVEAVVILGLAGTLIGLSMMIRGLDATMDYGAALEQLKVGAAIAFNTSLVGIAAGLWLNTGRRMLATATTTLLADANA